MINNIGLIGSGNMGGAFIKGWLQADPAMAQRITVSDTNPAAAQALSLETGVGLAKSNADLVEKADLILLAVKPHDVESALSETVSRFGGGKVLVSVAAGRSLQSLEAIFSEDVPVIRLMPNVAVAKRAGTISFVAGSYVKPEVEKAAIELFGLVGQVVPLPEKLFDAATAIGGSGPGFLALVTDAFVDAGIVAGLPLATSRKLTYSMLQGTAELLADGSLTPQELRLNVSSPGGTTAAGIAQLERDRVRSAIIDAVQAALARAQELG